MFSKYVLPTLIGIVAAAVAVFAGLIGFAYYSTILSGVLAGFATLVIEGLIWFFLTHASDELQQAAFYFGLIVVCIYYVWQFLQWLYIVAIIPFGNAYVALVAGVIAGNATSVAIAIPLGVALAILIGIGIWRLVVYIQNR